MQQTPPAILCIASYYPDPRNPFLGIYVQKHAEATARQCSVTVLNAAHDPDLRPGTYRTAVSSESGITVVRISFGAVVGGPLRSRAVSLCRYLKAVHIGFREACARSGKPQLVHAQIALPAGAAALYLNVRHCLPYILTEHLTIYSKADGGFGRLSLPYRFLARLVFRSAAAVTAVSAMLCRDLRDRKLLRTECTVIPNVVDRFPEELSRPSGQGPVNILTISLLSDAQKNVSGLIRAFARLVSHRSDVMLHIVGDGEDRTMLEDLARQHGILGSQIIFHGYVPNDRLASHFSRAHFFVLSSNYETFSVATAEALSHGVPVLVTRSGGPEEFVNAICGMTIPPANDDSLLLGLEHMLMHWSSYDSRAIQELARSRFNPDRIGGMFQALYGTVLRQ